MTMIYVIMTEDCISEFDHGLGRGEIIGVFDDLEKAIETTKQTKTEDYTIYEMAINKLYMNVNDIFKCVWSTKILPHQNQSH